MVKSLILLAALLGYALAQQGGLMEKQQQQVVQVTKDLNGQEPAVAESSAYGSRYRAGGYGGGGYGGVDPRYFDRGDTPHFGLAGFPFGYERRYSGQNIVYDNSLAGFPLNYHNYQQYSPDYSSYNSYKGSGSSGYKPQYRSSSYGAPKNLEYGKYQQYPSGVEYGAYLSKPHGGNNYYSLQYGY